MRKTKENGGITLVALVVTVVILLILAGVSISLVLGENGIVTKAKEAKYRQQVASIQDVIADELATIYIRRNEGETIDDNEKLDIIYSKLKENKLTSNVKKVANLVIVADKYVVSMTTGKEGELADPEKWVYQVQGEEGFGYEDSEDSENSDYKNWACILDYNGTEKDITIPEYVLKDGTIYVIRVLRRYDNNATFDSKANIESITVLDNITSIEYSMFCNMPDLKKVTIPDTVTTIGENAFGGDVKLEYANLPANLLKIDKSIFFKCYALSEITIPNKVESIGENAFALCLSIQKIEIPSSVKTIEAGAFGFMGIDDTADTECKGSTATDNYAKFGYQKGKLSEIILHEGLESVGEGAFRVSATVRKDLKLPTSLKDIGKEAFLSFGKVGGGKLYNSDGSLYTVN